MSGSSDTATCAVGVSQSAIKRGRRLPYSLLSIAVLLGAAVLYNGEGAGSPTAKPRSNPQWAHIYAALPLSFEANRGQSHPSVDFISRGAGYTLFLTNHESVLTLRSPQSSASDGHAPSTSSSALRLRLLGTNARATATGTDELPGKANYFIGNDRSKWRTNIPTYAKVKYAGIYPGVDLVYYGTQGGQLEYDFVVAPGAHPSAIRFAVNGTEEATRSPLCKLSRDGDLVVSLDKAEVRMHKPVVYQPEGTTGSRPSAKTLVDGRYVLQANNQVGFEIGAYDQTRPLVIDPTLLYATYVGGNGADVGYGIAVDTNFDAYIAGTTTSTNFPTAGSAYQSANKGGNGDAFVTKINAAGTTLLYSTYLGGTATDSATAIAVFAGAVFVTGNTTSADFPTVAPIAGQFPFQNTYGGNTDAFVSQLDATGQTLVYSSYLGGSGADFGQGIAVDSSGNAYVTGFTQSSNFPIVNAYQSGLDGSSDAFVAKVNFTGEALVYSTYLGGTSADVGQAIQVDTSGDAYVAGYTFSTDFPVVGPFQSVHGGGADAFVAELNPAGSSLTFSTYLGGAGDDRAFGIALDGSKNVYVAGETASGNFPTTGAFQPSLRGASNAFVTKLNTTGSALVYSTYLGGSGTDQANGIAVTSGGIASVTGFTNSSNFPTQSPVQGILGLSNNQLCGSAPCADAFISQFNAAGSALNYSTYLGGNGPDFGQSIAVDSTGDPYITGSTSSTNFPAVAGSYKSTLTGSASNAFIAKLDPENVSSISIVPYTLNFGPETLSVTSPYQQITISNMSTAPITISNILVYPVNGSSTVYTETDNCLGTIAGGGGYCTMNVSFTPNATTSLPDTIYITDNAGGIPGTQQIINLTGSGTTAATAVTVAPSSLSFPSQPVGTASSAQSVTVTNTGTQTLSISKISAGTTNDFTETDNCFLAPYFGNLGVSQSCTISVTFSPTASGTRSSALTVSDNATGSPQAVALTGIGAAAFTLTSPSSASCPTVNPIIIGSTQTTFCVEANGPTSFNGAISLACSAGTTCTFSTNPIFVGSTSLMTVSNLSPSTNNPYLFTVTGTSGTQTYTANFSLGFADYTLTVTPPIATVYAGTTGKYTILVNPLNSFNSGVLLECAAAGMPPGGSECIFPNGSQSQIVTPGPTSAASVALSVTTYKYVAPTHTWPWLPGSPNKLPPYILGLLSLAALASLAIGRKRGARRGWLAFRLAMLSLILCLDLALVACRSSVLEISGTTTGNYTLTLDGYLNSNQNVLRTTTFNLAVTASPTTN